MNFVGFEELGANVGIKLYYQFIDTNTKKNLYTQDFHKLECKYVYSTELEQIVILFDGDDVIKVSNKPSSGFSYFRLVPNIQ